MHLCPVCQEKMAKKTFEDKEFFECIYCWSHWIPAVDLSRYLHSKDDLDKYVNEVEANLEGNGKGVCPECDGAQLEKTRFKGVELDYCTRCGGTLFDYGELKKLYSELFKLDYEAIASDTRKVVGFVRLIKNLIQGINDVI